MTAPATQRRWFRYVYASFSEGPDKPPVIGCVFSTEPPRFNKTRPSTPRPKAHEPRLPAGAKILEGDTLLQFARNNDDISGTEIASARDWLAWRWVPDYKPKAEE